MKIIHKLKAVLPVLLPVLLVMMATEVRAQDIISVGPMMHINFGEKKPKVSWGVEAAAWWYKNQFPVSTSFGYERKQGHSIFYIQGQTGVALAGLSAGPYLELGKDGTAVLGLQTDYWVNYFVGLDYRVRYSGEGKQKALGLYIKAPFPIGPDEDGDDDDFDWDWD